MIRRLLTTLPVWWRFGLGVLPKARPGPLTIKLEDLAVLWLKYNEDFVRIEVPAAESPSDGVTEAANGAAAAAPSHETGNEVSGPAVQRASYLIQEFVMPYRGMLEMQNAYRPVLKLVDLLETYGDCPSVVLEKSNQDQEAKELYSIRDTLRQVTLRDHTIHVTQWGLQDLNKVFQDPEPLIPKMIVAALGHDLGKIPAFRASGLYSMRDHPDISVVKVREVFEGSGVLWLDEVIEAIRAHHRFDKASLSTLLKRADGRAREQETAAVSKEYKVLPWEDWFNVDDLLVLLGPKVNVLLRGNKWAAMSHEGIVYCNPDVLYEITRELAAKKKIVDITLIRPSDREIVLRKIIKSCQGAGVLAAEVGEGFYGRPYEIRLKTGRLWRAYLVPFAISAFRCAEKDLEGRKSGVLVQIDGIRPRSTGGD